MSESNEYVALNPQGRSSIESIQLNQLKPMSTAIMIHFSSAALLYNLYTHIHTLHKPLKHKGLILEPHQYNAAWQMFFKYLEKIQPVVLCLPIYLSTATLDDIFFGWIALSQRSSNPACWHALFLGQLVISSSPVVIFRRFHFHPSAYVSQVSGYHGRFVTKNTNHNHIVCCF